MILQDHARDVDGIARARKNGYAYNDIHVFRGMETITDMAAVSVPICASSGAPVAVLSVTAITQRLAPPRRDNIVAALRREVDAVQAAYRPMLDEMQPRAAMASVSDSPSPMAGAREPSGRQRGAPRRAWALSRLDTERSSAARRRPKGYTRSLGECDAAGNYSSFRCRSVRTPSSRFPQRPSRRSTTL